jgi:hypothetical protein
MSRSSGFTIKGSFYFSISREGSKWTCEIYDHTNHQETLITVQSSSVSEEIAAGKALLALREQLRGHGRDAQ